MSSAIGRVGRPAAVRQLARQIRAEHQASGASEPLDPHVVKLLVGRQMYAGEPQVCAWIDRLVADLFR